MPNDERQLDPMLMCGGIVDRALYGYTDSDEKRDAMDLDAFERIAAAIDLTTIETTEPMPSHLRSRILADASGVIARVADRDYAETIAEDNDDVRDASVDIEPIAFPGTARWTPWLVAAACLVVTTVTLVNSGSSPTTPVVDTPLSAVAMYEELTTAPNDAIVRVPWTDLKDAGVTGEIVWDANAQRGVLQINGLAANDPTITQYQLWIFDKQRKAFSEFDAVDGGVFDVTSDGMSYVAIDAALDIGSPYLFAVTNEPPGGVVKHVDDDAHSILLVAPVPEPGADEA